MMRINQIESYFPSSTLIIRFKDSVIEQSSPAMFASDNSRRISDFEYTPKATRAKI
jgi:hypothetical protein